MSGAPELKARKRLEKHWEQFINFGQLDQKLMNSPIFASWQRCKQAAVNPIGGVCHRILAQDHLERILECNMPLLKAATPVIESIYYTVRGSGFMVVLVNAEGIVLKTMGDSQALRNAELLKFFRGADWTEQSVGTNAIGTCLATGVPIQVSGAEHFCTGHHAWTCSAAPIRGPAGQILGCLDMSGPYDKMHPHTLGMIVAAALAIEGQLAKEFANNNNSCCSRVQILRPNHMFVDPKPAETSASRAPHIIGKSPQMRAVIELAERAAACPTTVLLLGESGTGKEVLARAIHQASRRSSGPFIPVNCASMPAGLVQSELFGYSDGAFTGARRGGQPGKFELADGGTLFLDEIGDMPLEMQASLLRVLQEKTVTRVGGKKAIPVDVRVIAATNKDLHQEVRKGNFRQDLYYRINVMTIEIPPLREREGDLELLMAYYLNELTVMLGKKISHIDPAAREILLNYHWPGNVRELANVLEQAIIVADEDVIMVRHLPRYIFSARHAVGSSISRISTLEQVEKSAIEEALARCKGNISRAAQELGIGRNTLYSKIKKYGIRL
ncbi:sigma-54-dependent Fis family transcriptional regulator [Desulfurispora thermophila]|uniref:sigma-54-dependent Fis family transcriptional regulator n=1 Tax=Desulfurispora thermophila TaxID=265470 RepID=UPI00036311C9|nr:sigma-54-dependent Fis family transcriptional regulator [Desulfurispora thermophila]